MLERLNEEIKRRTHVVRIFPNGESCLRLVRALAVETHENWFEGLNLPVYGPAVRCVVGVDTSFQSLRLARKQEAQSACTGRFSSELRRRAFRSPMRPSMQS